MTATFQQYTQRVKKGDQSVWLGQLVWYTVSESVRISHGLLSTALINVGLDDFSPAPPRDDDVFRRVCSAHQRKSVPTANPDIFENYLIRDVKRAGGKVWKQIVVEAVDGNNKRLAYEPAVSMEFDSATSKIAVETLPTTIDPAQAENLAELIKRDFKAERGTMNAYAIRELIRKVLLMSSATIVRPGGGVYFVSMTRNDKVTALEALAGHVNGTNVHTVPLLDDEKQREMLKKAFEAETIESIDKQLGEIDALLKGPEITEGRYADMVRAASTYKTKTTEYAELLDEQMGNAEFRMKALDKSLRKLLNHVKVPD